ncbi:MAG TPA: nitroreductase/quinone reductase family protein [Candidatus Limnocylindrales bacterium]
MIPPRLLLRIGWAFHKVLHAVSGHRVGTGRAPSEGRLGTLFLLSRGRTSGTIRRNGLFFVMDGTGYGVVASNAGADEDPAWWRNLQANPDAVVELGRASIPVRARRATDEERERIWARFVDAMPQYRAYAAATQRVIAAVILEPTGPDPGDPRPEPAGAEPTPDV